MSTTTSQDLAHKLQQQFGRYFLQTPNPGFWTESANTLLTDVVKEAKTKALEDAADAYPEFLRDMVTRHSVRVWLINRAESTKKGWLR